MGNGQLMSEKLAEHLFILLARTISNIIFQSLTNLELIIRLIYSIRLSIDRLLQIWLDPR